MSPVIGERAALTTHPGNLFHRLGTLQFTPILTSVFIDVNVSDTGWILQSTVDTYLDLEVTSPVEPGLLGLFLTAREDSEDSTSVLQALGHTTWLPRWHRHTQR